MNNVNILRQITHGIWFIEPEFAYSMGSVIASIFSGEKKLDEIQQSKFKQFYVEQSGAVTFPDYRGNFNNVQPASTAVISITNSIFKYDNCGDPGTLSIGETIRRADIHSNINSIVLWTDSPGGTVDGTMELAEIVKKTKKPVVVYVDGLMCSAMYWIGSGANYIIANNETSTIGSIGTMITFADAQPYWEKQGVKFHFITADASKDKNKDFLDMRKGNYAAIKERLNNLNDLFINSVQQNRPNIDKSTLSGKTYLASEAIKLGLIDEINSFEYAVELAQELARTASVKNASVTQKNLKTDNMKILKTHVALIAALGISFQENEMSKDVEMTAAQVSKLEEIISSFNSESNRLSSQVTSLKKENQTLTETIAEKDEKILELGKANPGTKTSLKEGNDTFTESEEKDEFLTEADLKLKEVKAALNK